MRISGSLPPKIPPVSLVLSRGAFTVDRWCGTGTEPFGTRTIGGAVSLTFTDRPIHPSLLDHTLLRTHGPLLGVVIGVQGGNDRPGDDHRRWHQGDKEANGGRSSRTSPLEEGSDGGAGRTKRSTGRPDEHSGGVGITGGVAIDQQVEEPDGKADAGCAGAGSSNRRPEEDSEGRGRRGWQHYTASCQGPRKEGGERVPPDDQCRSSTRARETPTGTPCGVGPGGRW